jgi:hypothetical protein
VEIIVPPTATVLNSEEPIVETEAIVEIAEIEASRDVTIAAIEAETEAARIASIENRESEEFAECRRELERLTGIVEQLTEKVNLLTPQVQSVVEVMEELPIVQEPDLIQPDMLVPTAEIKTELSEESEDQNEEEEAAASPVRKFIAI